MIMNVVVIFIENILYVMEVKVLLGVIFLECVDDFFNVLSYCFFILGSIGELKGVLIVYMGMMNYLYSKVCFFYFGVDLVVV